MILHVCDLKMKQCRQLPLAPNGHGALFRRFSNGGEHYHGIFWRRSSCASPGTGTLAISGNYCDHPPLNPLRLTSQSPQSIAVQGCLCAYDARHSSLLRIRPSSGHVDAFHLPLEAEGYTRLVAWHQNLGDLCWRGAGEGSLGRVGKLSEGYKPDTGRMVV